MADEDVVNPQPAGVKLTYDDFVLFPDDGQRHELIDGEHYVTPSPATKHQRVLGYLHLLIGNYLEVHPIVQVFLAPFDIVLSRFDVVEPDLLYMSSARAQEILTDQHVRGTPEFVVEIASPGTRRRDEGIKRRLYERSGVSEYWIVDADAETIRVYRRSDNGFGRFESFSRQWDDVLRTVLLPGLELQLARIFR